MVRWFFAEGVVLFDRILLEIRIGAQSNVEAVV